MLAQAKHALEEVCSQGDYLRCLKTALTWAWGNVNHCGVCIILSILTVSNLQWPSNTKTIAVFLFFFFWNLLQHLLCKSWVKFLISVDIHGSACHWVMNTSSCFGAWTKLHIQGLWTPNVSYYSGKQNRIMLFLFAETYQTCEDNVLQCCPYEDGGF